MTEFKSKYIEHTVEWSMDYEQWSKCRVAELESENDAWADKWRVERKENDKLREAAEGVVQWRRSIKLRSPTLGKSIDKLAALLEGKQDG